MKNLMSRPYAGEKDLEPMIDLLLECRTADNIDRWPTASELWMLLNSSSVEEKCDTRLWEDVGGNLMGFAMVWLKFDHLMFFVHPRWLGSDVEIQIIAWGTEQARKVGQERGERVRLLVRSRDEDADRIAFLERHGFVQDDWYTLRMIRPLDEAIPEPQFPEGFTLRHVEGEHEAEAYVAMHRDAFGTNLMTVEHRMDFMRGPYYIPELDLIAVAPDGTFAAFCVCTIDQIENTRLGRAEGWTDPVGTRPAFRRMGLARALLLSGFQRLKARGVDTAIMGTGDRNTAAQRAFESVGFRTIHKVLAYIKDVR